MNNNGVSKQPAFETLFIIHTLRLNILKVQTTISWESPYLTQLDGIGLTELKD